MTAASEAWLAFRRGVVTWSDSAAATVAWTGHDGGRHVVEGRPCEALDRVVDRARAEDEARMRRSA